MFSSARSIIATLVLSTIVVGTPPLAGSESWADFFRDLFSIADYESMIEDENKLTDQLNRKDAVILGRINLLQLAKSSIKMSDAHQQDYEKFMVLVEKSECEGSAVSLPLPPVFLITDMFN